MPANLVHVVAVLLLAIISPSRGDTRCLYSDEPATARAISKDFSALLAIQTENDWDVYFRVNEGMIRNRLELLMLFENIGDEKKIAIKQILTGFEEKTECADHARPEPENEGKRRAYTLMLLNTALSLALNRERAGARTAFDNLIQLAADSRSVLQDFDWTISKGVPMFTKWMIILYGMQAEAAGNGLERFKAISEENAEILVCYLDQTHFRSINSYLHMGVSEDIN